MKRIKHLQKLIGAVEDGVIGKETLSKFALKFDKNRIEVIHFFANIHHESGGFKIVRENMRYSAPRIMQIFGVGKHSARVTQTEANQLSGKGYELAERVYGLGNPAMAKNLGNTKQGDGWKYRGGGSIQITGGWAYRHYGSQELYDNPDLIADSEYYFTTAITYFDKRSIWAKAKDLSDGSINAVCKAINGGYNGLSERRRLTNYYNSIWK